MINYSIPSYRYRAAHLRIIIRSRIYYFETMSFAAGALQKELAKVGYNARSYKIAIEY